MTTASRVRRAARSALAIPVLIALVAACGGTPTAPELTDPVAILEAAATQAATARSVHVDLTADGQLALDLTGTGTAAPIQLTDTSAALDLDIANAAAKVTFALPGILGLRGELIAVDGTGFFKTSLTGPLYQKMSLGEAGIPATGASPNPAAISDMVSQLLVALAQPGVDPAKGADAPCGSATCYSVSIQLTPDEIAALGASTNDLPLPGGLPVPIPDVSDQTVDVTFRVDKATTRLAGLSLAVAGGQTGQLTGEFTFSKWDESITISAPPADQVTDGG